MPGAFGTDEPRPRAAAAAPTPGTDGIDLVAEVTTDRRRTRWATPTRRSASSPTTSASRRTILRHLVGAGCHVEVVPAAHPAAEVLARAARRRVPLQRARRPRRGRPARSTPSRRCSAPVPVFGICLGHQILGLALGASTVKLPFGHHGANHPVRHEATGRVEITSQNHNYAVDADALAATCTQSPT